jgi:hypothetical protein
MVDDYTNDLVNIADDYAIAYGATTYVPAAQEPRRDTTMSAEVPATIRGLSSEDEGVRKRKRKVLIESQALNATDAEATGTVVARRDLGCPRPRHECARPCSRGTHGVLTGYSRGTHMRTPVLALTRGNALARTHARAQAHACSRRALMRTRAH